MGLKVGLARIYLRKWYISGCSFRVFWESEGGFLLLLRGIQNEVYGAPAGVVLASLDGVYLDLQSLATFET